MNRELLNFQSRWGVLSRLCEGKVQQTFSHFKCHCAGNSSTVSLAASSPRATGWEGLLQRKTQKYKAMAEW